MKSNLNSALFLTVALSAAATGCAWSGDLKKVQSESREAHQVADQAYQMAEQAKDMAQAADERSQRNEEVLNRHFKRSMYK